jgi:hypothetical protein
LKKKEELMALVQDSLDNRDKCICSKCPSFPHACENELLYCALDASRCSIEVKGCICNFCKVYAENKLEGLYFCDKEYVGDSRIFMRKKRPTEDLETYWKIIEIKDRSKEVSTVRSP